MEDKDGILFFDTETTGLPPRRREVNPVDDAYAFPHICQLSWTLDGIEHDFIIKPAGWTIPMETSKVHGITTERAMKEGVPLTDALRPFCADLQNAKTICAHNANFDIGMLIADYTRLTSKTRGRNFADYIRNKPCIDTMMLTVDYVGARFSNGQEGKFPRLEELYSKLFDGATFPAHNSMEDVRALAKCYYELVEKQII